MNKKNVKRVIFFDVDGTLHQQDMFGYFLRYLLKHLPYNLLLVLLVLPLIIGNLILKGYTSSKPINLLLWSITFGHSDKHLRNLQIKFTNWFRKIVIYFPIIRHQLDLYISNKNNEIWLITGSPEILVKEIYSDLINLPSIKLIGSVIYRKYGGWMLSVRCIGYEKVVQLKNKLGAPIKLYSGYSDNKLDKPLLNFCQYRWLVTKDGKLQQLH